MTYHTSTVRTLLGARPFDAALGFNLTSAAADRQRSGHINWFTAQTLGSRGAGVAAARRHLGTLALTCCIAMMVYSAPVAAAVIEGQALYRERIMPPSDAVLVVTMWDAARADAPATELANARQRLTGAPPYRWTLMLDDLKAATSPGAVVRARIEVDGAMWMTTDTVTSAFSTPPPVLVLRMVQAVPTTPPAVTPATPATPSSCAQADTQAALNACAYDQFLDASAGLTAQLRQVESRLSPGQRQPWRKVQKAWLGYRTEACRFESASTGAGSAANMVQWQCSARLTRMRSEELARSLACREGDLSCVLRRRAGGGS